MKMTIVCAVFIFLGFFGSVASAELPSGPNVQNAWSQDAMEGLRIVYGYTSLNYESPDPTFHCRVDYYHDGRIRLLAVEGYYHIPGSPISTIDTIYFLRVNLAAESTGNELVRISYKQMSGPDLKIEPVITKEDLFAKRCVPLLDGLFKQIPSPEVKMWKDQYGSVFGVK